MNGLVGASNRRFDSDVWVLDLAGLGPAKLQKPILAGTSKMPKKYKMPSPEPANSSSRSLVRPHRRTEDQTPRPAQTLPHREP
ncbi:hypothetical protein FH972_000917 [Carpinus fangiana]|uniref:Uncharacterized protein n=1 Tax=Carpinus fangiana TaxID=176857 RepID=A0A5N6QAH3_9ROSI|nr:hypothetical protein FH972_000917 [Carpinus fangiana]